MEVEKEIWRNISGYPDYQISNMGRVKSLKFGKERILKPVKDKVGYLIVNLRKENKMKSMKVHRLVASAFVQNNSIFNTEINHIDECKTNNCASNLEWSDRSHNCNYGTRIERISKANTNGKKSKAVKCLETNQIFPSTMEIERKFGFSHTHISDACIGKYKQAYGYHWKYVE